MLLQTNSVVKGGLVMVWDIDRMDALRKEEIQEELCPCGNQAFEMTNLNQRKERIFKMLLLFLMTIGVFQRQIVNKKA